MPLFFVGIKTFNPSFTFIFLLLFLISCLFNIVNQWPPVRFEEYADYSLNKLYNFNELLIDTIHQLQFKQMAVQELITHRLDNICPKEKTN
jgi:hypothetical protein